MAEENLFALEGKSFLPGAKSFPSSQKRSYIPVCKKTNLLTDETLCIHENLSLPGRLWISTGNVVQGDLKPCR